MRSSTSASARGSCRSAGTRPSSQRALHAPLRRCEHVFDSMIVCVLLPRFELAVAAGGRAALAQGPMALAPEPGREQVVGEVSQAAEALGIHPGMRLGEALARAPRLALTPPDPVGVADAWERVLARLEAVGAAVESERPGSACFEARGLRRLHGGSLDGTVDAVRAALRLPARIGAGPSRFCAVAAARPGAHPPRAPRARRRGSGGRAGRPAAPPRADRAPAGRARAPGDHDARRARGAARAPRSPTASGRPACSPTTSRTGSDTPLRPRTPREVLEETLDLEESASGEQLERALGLLDRPPARAARAPRAHAARRRPLGDASSRAGRGASGSSSASRPPTRCACASRWSPGSRCCPRPPSRCG